MNAPDHLVFYFNPIKLHLMGFIGIVPNHHNRKVSDNVNINIPILKRYTFKNHNFVLCCVIGNKYTLNTSYMRLNKCIKMELLISKKILHCLEFVRNFFSHGKEYTKCVKNKNSLPK